MLLANFFEVPAEPVPSKKLLYGLAALCIAAGLAALAVSGNQLPSSAQQAQPRSSYLMSVK